MAEQKRISKKRFLLLQRKVPIDLDEFALYEELEPTERPWGVITTLAFEYRPRREWNTKGREIFAVRRIKRLGQLLNCFQRDFSSPEWTVESTANVWWRKGLAPSKLKAVQGLCSWDVRQLLGFSGGLHLKDCDPSFLNLLIALPYCFNLCTVDMYSMSEKIVVQFSDHLDISIVTQDKALWKRICVWARRKRLSIVPYWIYRGHVSRNFPRKSLLVGIAQPDPDTHLKSTKKASIHR